jgi:hypothetical protein
MLLIFSKTSWHNRCASRRILLFKFSIDFFYFFKNWKCDAGERGVEEKSEAPTWWYAGDKVGSYFWAGTNLADPYPRLKDSPLLRQYLGTTCAHKIGACRRQIPPACTFFGALVVTLEMRSSDVLTTTAEGHQSMWFIRGPSDREKSEQAWETDRREIARKTIART